MTYSIPGSCRRTDRPRTPRVEDVTYIAGEVLRLPIRGVFEPDFRTAMHCTFTFDGAQLTGLGGGVFVPQHFHKIERLICGHVNTYQVCALNGGSSYEPTADGRVVVELVLINVRKPTAAWEDAE